LDPGPDDDAQQSPARGIIDRSIYTPIAMADQEMMIERFSNLDLASQSWGRVLAVGVFFV
jgi:hypothetical protein